MKINGKVINKEFINDIETAQKNIFKNTIIYNNYFNHIKNNTNHNIFINKSKPITINSEIKQIGDNCYNYITNSI